MKAKGCRDEFWHKKILCATCARSADATQSAKGLYKWLQSDCSLTEIDARQACLYLTGPTIACSSEEVLKSLGDKDLEQTLAGLAIGPRCAIKGRLAQDPAKVAAINAAKAAASNEAADAKLAKERASAAATAHQLSNWLCSECGFNKDTVAPVLVRSGLIHKHTTVLPRYRALSYLLPPENYISMFGVKSQVITQSENIIKCHMRTLSDSELKDVGYESFDRIIQ
jgi:hypothetical protein